MTQTSPSTSTTLQEPQTPPAQSYDKLFAVTVSLISEVVSKDKKPSSYSPKLSTNILVTAERGMGKTHLLVSSMNEVIERSGLERFNWPVMPMQANPAAIPKTLSPSISAPITSFSGAPANPSNTVVCVHLDAAKLHSLSFVSLLKELPLLAKNAAVFIILEDIAPLSDSNMANLSSLVNCSLPNVVVALTANKADLHTVTQSILNRCITVALTQNPNIRSRLDLASKREGLNLNPSISSAPLNTSKP